MWQWAQRDGYIHGDYQEESYPIHGRVYERLLCAQTRAGHCLHSWEKDKLLVLVSGGTLRLLKSCL